MRKAKKHSILPVVSPQLTTTVSVTLVLIVLGLVALVGIAAHSATHAANVSFILPLVCFIAVGAYSLFALKRQK